MSNIPKARDLLRKALADPARYKRLVRAALREMTRQSPIRRTPPKRVAITMDMREDIFRLADRRPKLTEAEIARRVGLPNGGRVSEVLNGKR